MSQKNVSLRIYRDVRGIRTPYRLVLDSQSNVISEHVDEMALSQMYNQEQPAPELKSVREVEDPKASVVKDGRDGFQAKFAHWMQPDNKEGQAFFPNTEALRQDYHRKREKMLEANPNCPGCKLGELAREYRNILRLQFP